MENDDVRLVAHRGWSSRFPENSLPALAAAIGAEADEIEFDVRLSKDGVPFLCHDPVVDRVSTLSGSCRDFTMRELKAADIVGPDDTRYARLGFASLMEVLGLFGKKTIMNIHIKEAEAVDATIRCILDQGLTPEDVYIAGDPGVLEKALDIAPRIPRCCLAGSDTPEKQLERAVAYRCRRVQFRRGRYDRESVRKCVELGMIPNLFYADEPQEAEDAIAAGIVALLTNDLGPMRKHLLSRGILKERPRPFEAH